LHVNKPDTSEIKADGFFLRQSVIGKPSQFFDPRTRKIAFQVELDCLN